MQVMKPFRSGYSIKKREREIQGSDVEYINILYGERTGDRI